MSWILISIGFILFLLWMAKLRGALLGVGLTILGASILLLSRFHLRKSTVVLGALFFTWVAISLFSEILKARKK
jgi:hypothetical protein